MSFLDYLKDTSDETNIVATPEGFVSGDVSLMYSKKDGPAITLPPLAVLLSRFVLLFSALQLTYHFY